MKQWIYTALRGAISLILIVLLLYIMRGNYDTVADILRYTDISIFACSIGIFILAISIASLRLKMIIAAQDLKISFLEAISLTFIGYFFNNFLPTSIGGDVVKAYYVSKKTHNKASAYASVFMDRFLGLLTMIVMAALALLFLKGVVNDDTVRYMILGAVAIAIVFLVFIFNKNFAVKFSFLLRFFRPIEGKIKDLYTTVHGYRKHRFLLGQSVALSFFSQAIYFYSFVVIALSIGSFMSFKELFLRIPLVCALALLPSINGLGVREGSIVALLGPLIGRESAFAVSILALATLMITSLIGGLIYALSPQFKISKNEKLEVMT